MAIRIRPVLVALLLGTMTTGTGLAQTASVADGHQLASGLCARCHVIERGGGSGWTDAPSFESIANRPEVTGARLSNVVLTPHKKMSVNTYSRAEASSIAAYIMSLRGP